MNRDSLLAWLEINIERWPRRRAGVQILPNLPSGCKWGRGPITDKWLAYPVRDPDGRGAAIGEGDWSAAIRAHRLNESRADGNDGDHYVTEEEEEMPAETYRSKYHREIKPGVFVDVYDVLAAWEVKNPALQHLIKKALMPGERGHKPLIMDMNEIVMSAKRARELEGKGE